MSAVVIRIPEFLQQYCEGVQSVEVSARTVGEALKALKVLEYIKPSRPSQESFLGHIFTGTGQLRSSVQVLLGQQNVFDLLGMETPVQGRQVLSIVFPQP